MFIVIFWIFINCTSSFKVIYFYTKLSPFFQFFITSITLIIIHQLRAAMVADYVVLGGGNSKRMKGLIPGIRPVRSRKAATDSRKAGIPGAGT